MLPLPETPYVTSFEEIAWGIALIAVTLVVHGAGTTWAVLVTSPRDPDKAGSAPVELGRIIVFAEILVLIHLFEVMIWAAFFLWTDSFRNLSGAYYFALLEYTTIGSIYNLPPRWRLLEGMIAICGLLTFAWSTGVLMTTIQAIQQRRVATHLEKRRMARREARSHAGEQA